MKVLLDNTGVHRVLTAITIGDASKPITYWEALGLLNFAEHIMFSEGMQVSTYERPSTIEKTNQLVETLKTAGCISDREDNCSLIQTDFSHENYANACRSAAAQVLTTLQAMRASELIQCATMIDQASKPDGIKLPATEKWLEREFSLDQRTTMMAKAYENKGPGTFDLVIGSNDPLYGQLQLLRPQLTRTQRKRVAYAIDAFVRVAVNQQLWDPLESTCRHASLSIL